MGRGTCKHAVRVLRSNGVYKRAASNFRSARQREEDASFVRSFHPLSFVRFVALVKKDRARYRAYESHRFRPRGETILNSLFPDRK